MATSSEKLAKAVAANAIDSATAKSPPAPSTAAIIRRLKDTVVLLTAVTAAAAGLSAKSDEEAGGRSGDGGSMRYFNLVKYDYAEVFERRCVFLSYVNVDI